MASIKQKNNIYKLQAHIEVFDKADNWNESTRRCGVCLKSFQGFFCETPDGRVCIFCATEVYDHFVSTHEIVAWPYSRFISALSGGEPLRWRLTILSRYIEAVKTAQRQKSDVNAMHRLLVSNLDNWIDHPLKDTVCKLAFGAAVWVGKPMLPMLLAYQDKQDPWLIYCDIALCVSRIAPDDKRVQEFFEKALKHPVPEARTKIIGILSEHKSIWARNILKELRKDANLAEQLTAIPIPDELSPLETVIIENYKLDVLKSIYSSYLIFVFQEISFTVNKNAFAVGKLTKRQLVWAFAQVFSQKDLFDKLLSILPPGVIQVLNRLTWEKGEHSIQSFAEPLDPPIIIQSEEIKNAKTISVENLNPCYAICLIKRNHVYHYYMTFDLRTSILFLPEIVRALLKTYLPPPDGYNLKGLSTIEKTDFVYEDGTQILRQIHLLCTYIAQGHLKYSKNTAKILKASAKEMAAYCHVHEFYAEKNTDMEYLNTSLIVDFLQDKSIKETQSAPEFLKMVFDGLFTKIESYSDYHLNRLLFHLKGIHNLQGGYNEQSHQKNEQIVRASLRNLLRSLSPGLWYSVKQLLEYCHYRDIGLDIVDRSFASRYLSVNIRCDDGTRYSAGTYRVADISAEMYQEALILPFFKGFMFLMAAFGVVDIAYNHPKNEHFQKIDKDYLSTFDGLQYIRLTPLGAYIVGLTKNYAFKCEVESANLVLDEKRLLINLDGKDQLKTMVLGQFADKISENCYKVSCGSFLKACDTQEDINGKIGLFRKQMPAKLPRIWEDFLNDILNKIDPLIPEPTLSVFRLKEHPELIELMARDEILQKCVLKAEGYHVLIPVQNLNKVKKRLEAFGYFIDQLK